MKTDRKPPLGKSPMRLRTRRALQPANTNTPLRTPMASMNKTQIKESGIKRQYQSASCELKALSKMVQAELGALSAKAHGDENNPLLSTGGFATSDLFERGRFYDEYTARRNERLRKKKEGANCLADEPKSAYSLGVKKVESAKKRVDAKKKAESLKKSVAAEIYSVDRSQHPRYALRSSTRKPPLAPVPMAVEVTATARRSTRRK